MIIEFFAAARDPGLLVQIGHCCRTSFFMFIDTFWALVLGFGISGAVRTFVSPSAMQKRLGNHGPLAVTRASLYGAASSSCSYAAAATAKSLFGLGADFVSAMVFMCSSTNLVVELGIVIAVLLGWQFVLAQLFGGVIMIVLLAALGARWFKGLALERASALVESTNAKSPATGQRQRARVRSLGSWAKVAGFAIGDLKMLRRELVIGFVLAGVLATFVPVAAWNVVFVHGHGWLTELENALVGPGVALLSSVCSIGNVPLAAALWRGGISFGGVVSFIFADLLALPLLLVYRRLFGFLMALRMLVLFWLIMSISGLVVGQVFETASLVPTPRHSLFTASTLSFDSTTVLDLIALGALITAYLLQYNPSRLGKEPSYARDPVCGMQVEMNELTTSVVQDGVAYYFCSPRCLQRFVDSHPQRAKQGGGPSDRDTSSTDRVFEP